MRSINPSCRLVSKSDLCDNDKQGRKAPSEDLHQQKWQPSLHQSHAGRNAGYFWCNFIVRKYYGFFGPPIQVFCGLLFDVIHRT